MEKPGFGWSNINSRENVVLAAGGKPFDNKDIQDGFPGRFVQEFCVAHGVPCENVGTPEDFSSRITTVMDTFFEKIGKLDELQELRTTGKSNNRSLKWDIMSLAPNCAFRLHAHPNVELVYVIAGAINEFRYRGSPPKDYSLSAEDNEGPDFSQDAGAPFESLTTSAATSGATSGADSGTTASAGFLINEKGSVHLSYTGNQGCHLLILWSGCHANVSQSKYPPRGVLPELPAGVELLHKDP
jgi:hypothetical protein